MIVFYTRVTALVAVALALVASGCSLVGTDDPTLEEGAQLAIEDHVSDLPGSRQQYAGLATFFTTGGGIHILDPGTGTDDPPRLLRTLTIENHSRWDAQLDDNGYLWLATPDAGGGGSIQVTYVIDPHTGRVHRAIDLPDNLSAVASIAIGPDNVYLRAWRDGFSGGVGSVSRACVMEARDCDVRFVKDLGNVGTTPERGLRYDPDGSLFAFSGSNSRDERASTLRLEPATGAEQANLPLSGESRFDFEHVYMLFFRVAGPNDATQYLTRYDKLTLALEDEVAVANNLSWMAFSEGLVYLTSSSRGAIEVYSADTMEQVETIPLPTGQRPSAVFGFLSPKVLLLNEHAWLNTETNDVTTDAFPLESAFSQALRHGQGHPLAY